MNITTIDIRHPITIALCELSKSENSKLLEKFKGEMIDLVIEVAKKFTGFNTVESIKKSLEITLGVLSIGLIHIQKKSNESDLCKPVVELGLKELIKIALSLIKEISQYPEDSQNVFQERKTFNAREYISKYALARNEANGVWTGYDLFQKELASLKSNKETIDLAKWLIQFLSGNMFDWKEKNRPVYGDSDIYPSADNIINTLLFRFVCNFETKGKMEMTKNQFVSEREKFESNPDQWMEIARARYKLLVSKIPRDLQNALVVNQRDWFERHFKDGPVKVLKGKITDMDLDELWPYTVRGI